LKEDTFFGIINVECSESHTKGYTTTGVSLRVAFSFSLEGVRAMIRINGEEVDVLGMTIAEYLQARGYRAEVVAVELNGDIVPRESFDAVRFDEGDTAEVVRFVGGG
jgi:thiamine biosynthesis protein ThiS